MGEMVGEYQIDQNVVRWMQTKQTGMISALIFRHDPPRADDDD
jgi:hypothetical protein